MNYIRRMDWLIVLILLMFTLLSSLLIHSATVDDPSVHIDIKKHLFLYAAGFVVFFIVAMFNYRWLLRYAWLAYIAGIALLAALLKWGVVKNGARGWFKLTETFDFQPAELIKLILIITIAAILMRRDGDPLRLMKDVIPIGLVVLVPFLLVFMQPDLGNAIIYVVILLGMYWIGNMRLLQVLIGTAICVGGVFLFLYLFQEYNEPIQAYLQSHNKGHWVTRINTFIDPSNASLKDEWQTKMSVTAISSGGLTGEGYLQGTSIHKNFIPYAYSDSIFVVVGEEFGFQGAAILLALYFVLIYRMIVIAIESTDRAGSYIIIGIVSMYVFQIFQNIGMLIGLMPLTGITLPFVSYGGSSLLINMISLGLVASVRIHQKQMTEQSS